MVNRVVNVLRQLLQLLLRVASPQVGKDHPAERHALPPFWPDEVTT